jgi:hypothetical protein
MRIARLLAALITLATPAMSYAQAPSMAATGRFESGFVAGGQWEQATAMPLDREAIHSGSFDLSWRRNGWAYTAGWERIARDLTTVQGGTLSLGKLLSLGPVSFIPAVSVLGGQVYSSRDSTGYDFIDAQGVVGHMPRYSYSDGFAFGGGAGLTIEYAVYWMFGIRASATQWLLGGAPLEDDRHRTVVGVGLSLRVRR